MIIRLRPCGLTLEDYARITGLNPCLFVGLAVNKSCDPFTCERRKIFLGARDLAQQMIERATDAYLCDRPDSLLSLQPYFKKQVDFDPVEIITVDVTGDLTYAETPYLCQRLATLTMVLDPLPLDCYTLESITVLWPPCDCPRFDPSWCNVAYDERTGTLTAQTLAFSLVDPAAEQQDQYGRITLPPIDDPDIYLTELTVRLTYTKPRDQATSVWSDPCCLNSEPPEDPCESDCCPDVEKLHCLNDRGHVWTLDPSDDCRCTCFQCPKFYRLEGMRRGIWRPELAEAVVSLMNNLLPQSYCGCNEVSAMRYKRDTLIGDRDIAANYFNPFGILTPGALLAWRIVSNVIGQEAILFSL